jgi:hypothetical protein
MDDSVCETDLTRYDSSRSGSQSMRTCCGWSRPTNDDSRPSPRTEALMASAVQLAERIMRKIDKVFPDD